MTGLNGHNRVRWKSVLAARASSRDVIHTPKRDLPLCRAEPTRCESRGRSGRRGMSTDAQTLDLTDRALELPLHGAA